MNLQAFAICQLCAELYPSSRGCPDCDGDRESAQLVAEARCHAHAAESPVVARRPRRRRSGGLRRAQQLTIVAGLGVTAVVGTLLLLSA